MKSSSGSASSCNTFYVYGSHCKFQQAICEIKCWNIITWLLHDSSNIWQHERELGHFLATFKTHPPVSGAESNPQKSPKERLMQPLSWRLSEQAIQDY